MAVSGGATLNTVYTLYSILAAEAIGLNAAYDTANKVLVNYHLDEIFRLNPIAEVHLMLVAQTVTLAQMCDKANNYLKKILRDAGGKVRYAGVVRNPIASYTSTLSGGLDADVLAAILKAQELADDEYASDRPINNIVIEGRELNGTFGSATDLGAMAAIYRDVSVCVLQDPAIAALDVEYTPTAAVGTYLGVISKKEASESFAQPVEKFNLLDVAKGRFLSVNLSNNQPITNYANADLDALHDKRFVFGRTFNNYSGVYFNQSHNCASETDDYNASELRAVMNRAVRLTRPVLIPRINSTEFIVEDGRIVRRQTAVIEADIRSALVVMQSDISSVTYIIVDPEKDNLGQNYPSFLSVPKLRVLIGVIPKGKAETIEVEIGYTQG